MDIHIVSMFILITTRIIQIIIINYTCERKEVINKTVIEKQRTKGPLNSKAL